MSRAGHLQRKGTLRDFQRHRFAAASHTLLSAQYTTLISEGNFSRLKLARMGQLTDGLVERFNRTVLDKLFRTAYRSIVLNLDCRAAEALGPVAWAIQYLRPYQGYRDMGKRPIDTFREFSKPVWKRA